MAASENPIEPTGPIVSYREMKAEERDAIDSLDDSFTITEIYEVGLAAEGLGFNIRRQTTETLINKHYPDSDSDSESNYGSRRTTESDPSKSHAIVATADDGQICGAIDVLYRSWNSRLVIMNITVVPEYRRMGVGKKLMDMALTWGREIHGAKHAWLEVSNLNAPTIEAYRKMGFRFCGLDSTLYEGTSSKGEIALYMSRSC
uniref:Streptothricin acetyltransferase n=1 Tax=Coccidioides posadasii RMSCC 3488 TaxID=454284 RepID=A0A0J6F696_COCPO|nr:streptothricin acetyltransferase [Coccidioides posadasii RMSCC 3488]